VGSFLLPPAYVINEYGYFILRQSSKSGKAGGLISSWVTEPLFQCVPCLPKP
jgi:hypothetical protein